MDMQEIMYGPPDAVDRVNYLRIHPKPIQLPNAGYLGYAQPGTGPRAQVGLCPYVGYGAPPIAAVHPAAADVGEYNGWVSLAKVAMQELGIKGAENYTDVIDSSFTDAVFAFQEEYAELFDLEPTGYLDPETTKALSTVYEQVFGSVPPLAPIYMVEDGIMVGYPTKKKGMSLGAKIALGLGGAAALGVGILAVIATRD